jgi:hypothetical protein
MSAKFHERLSLNTWISPQEFRKRFLLAPVRVVFETSPVVKQNYTLIGNNRLKEFKGNTDSYRSQSITHNEHCLILIVFVGFRS